MVVKTKNTLSKEVGASKNKNIAGQSKKKMVKGGQVDSSTVYKDPRCNLANDAYPLMSQTNDYKPVEQLGESVQNSVDNYWYDRVQYTDAKFFQAGKKINAHYGVMDVPTASETYKSKSSNYIVGGNQSVAVPVATARNVDKSALPNGGTFGSNIRNTQQAEVFSERSAQAPVASQYYYHNHTVLPYAAPQNLGIDARGKLDGAGYFGGSLSGVIEDGGENNSNKQMNKPMKNNFIIQKGSTASVTSRNLQVGHTKKQARPKDLLGIGITEYQPNMIMAGGGSNVNYQNWY